MEQFIIQQELLDTTLKYELERIQVRNQQDVEWILRRKEFEMSSIERKINEIKKKNNKNWEKQIGRQLLQIEKTNERFEHAYQYYYERDKASKKNAIKSHIKKRDKLVKKLILLEEI
jgi:hypothetical protein